MIKKMYDTLHLETSWNSSVLNWGLAELELDLDLDLDLDLELELGQTLELELVKELRL